MSGFMRRFWRWLAGWALRRYLRSLGPVCAEAREVAKAAPAPPPPPIPKRRDDLQGAATMFLREALPGGPEFARASELGGGMILIEPIARPKVLP